LDINRLLGFWRPDILAVAPGDMNLAGDEIAKSEYLQRPRHGGRIGLSQDGQTRNRTGAGRLLGGELASISIDHENGHSFT